MPKRPKEAPIICDHFTWYLRQKPSGVFFADGRLNSKFKLGKPSLGTRDRQEALRLLRNLDKAMAIELGLIPASSQHMQDKDVTIERGWQLYIERCEQPEMLGGIGPASLKSYRSKRKIHTQFCSEHGIQNWSEINKKTTTDFGNSRARAKRADRTIVSDMNLICSVSKWLVEQEYLPASCRFLLKLSKPEGTTTYCYEKKQVVRMTTYCNSHKDLKWLGQVIVALATSGLRINELAKLRWSDIDLASGTIRLTDERSRPRTKQTGQERRIKGKRGRALPLHPAFRKVLSELTRQADGLIFHGQMGHRLSDRRVLEALKERVLAPLAAEFPVPIGETGFSDGTIHSFRHYFCSEAYRNGATEAELLAWLGHRDSNIMKLYRHLRQEDSHRRMAQINFLGGDDGKDASIDVV